MRLPRHGPRFPSIPPEMRLSTHLRAHSTVSASEVTHFNALASSWWDPHGPSRLLHLMNPLRHKFIQSCFQSQPDAPRYAANSLRYLDVGCGGGIFAESAARLRTTKSVTAIDPTPDVLAVAKQHALRDPLLTEKAGRLRYLQTSIELLRDALQESGPAEELEGYDVVSLFEVLEHVESPSAFLEQLVPHVKPGGWLVFSTIARTWTSWVVTKLVAEDLMRIVPPGTHEWSKYVNESELRAWFAKDGQSSRWESPRALGVVYVPGLGWKEFSGSEEWGNYFFAIRRKPEPLT